MCPRQQFGGVWTIEKLDILSGYLNFYLKALKNQPFNKIYIDAFAGTGNIEAGENLIEGSARLALRAENKFDSYIFIEKNKTFASELDRIVLDEFPRLKDRVTIHCADCNLKLIELCQAMNWKKNRAILFLDPHALDVKWETLEVIASTKAIDLWYLFPLSATNRLMKNNGEIEPLLREKLNSIFGDSKWFGEFYEKDPQLNLFENNEKYIKIVDMDLLIKYILERLKTIFPEVARNSRILYNSKNSPMFLFCFAVSNPNAVKVALKVANYILNKQI